MIFRSFKNYKYIEKTVSFLTQSKRALSLDDLCIKLGLNEKKVRIIFKSWGHVCPIYFMNSLSFDYPKNKLQGSNPLAFQARRKSVSNKVSDVFHVSYDFALEKDFKIGNSKLEIFYGFHETIFGECLFAVTNNSFCHFSFINKSSRESALKNLELDWKTSKISKDSTRTQKFIDCYLSKKSLTSQKKKVPLLLKGTAFQIKVWECLLSVPFGECLSYSQIASAIHKESAVRAVASAVAKNKIAYFIPCHRIIPKSGGFGNYRWGKSLKKSLLAFEISFVNSLLFDVGF